MPAEDAEGSGGARRVRGGARWVIPGLNSGSFHSFPSPFRQTPLSDAELFPPIVASFPIPGMGKPEWENREGGFLLRMGMASKCEQQLEGSDIWTFGGDNLI